MPKDKRKKAKPTANMWQNTAFLVAEAWRGQEKKVPLLCLLLALCGFGASAVELYFAPAILAGIEQGASIPQLLQTILFFTALLLVFTTGRAYCDGNKRYGRVQLRMLLFGKTAGKSNRTSYPNLFDGRFQMLRDKAQMGVLQGEESPCDLVWEALSALLQNLLCFALYLTLMTALNPWLILLVAVTSLGGYAVNHVMSGYEYRHQDELRKIYTGLGYFSNQARSSSLAKDLRLFGMRPWLEEVYQRMWKTLWYFQKKNCSGLFWASVADLVLAFLRNAIAYSYLFYVLLQNGMDASQFLLYFSAISGFSGWVTGILAQTVTLYRQSLFVGMLRECLDYPEPFRFSEGAPLDVDPEKPYEIRLENVSFRYPGGGEDVLHGIDLTLHAGESLAVVGVNGAGKTTLVKLLSGFYDPTEGRVLLNGQDIRQYNRRDYYRLFSAVFQDFDTLPSSVAENVAQQEEGFDRGRVRACLAYAGLERRVEALPRGMDTRLGRRLFQDGVELSGGEMQRLMLARALYKNGPVLLLDEPTAALDPLAEAEVYEQYRAMTRGRSSVYISHRLASTRFCDRVVLLENGRIAEEGTHGELLRRGGRYAELFQVQSKYYQEGEMEP